MSKELGSCVGKRFGKLLVVERAANVVNPSGKSVITYKCRCDCGTEKIIRKCHLVSGKIVSCGCFHNEQLGKTKKKHGFSHKERLYGLWTNMKDRCYNKNNSHYMSYGGRGISVCDDWKDDYLSFRSWCLSNRYEEKIRKSGRNDLTIDRINVDGDYEPDNCRFLTNKENCLNKRNTLTNQERYKTCPVCGKQFEVKRRNEKQTCGVKCGQVLRLKKIKLERNPNGTFKKNNS